MRDCEYMSEGCWYSISPLYITAYRCSKRLARIKRSGYIEHKIDRLSDGLSGKELTKTICEYIITNGGQK